MRRKHIKAVVLVMILSLIVGSVIKWDSTVISIAMVLAGRNVGCPWRQAIRNQLDVACRSEIGRAIRSSMRLVKRDSDGFELWDTSAGQYWAPSGNDHMVAGTLGEQKCGIYSSGDRGVRAGDIVLDCGANIGVYTRVALAAGAKLVVAIEPAPDNLTCLRRNLAEQINSGRVVVYEKGVWDRDDYLSLSVNSANAAADSLVLGSEHQGRHVRVALTTIDKLVDELGLPRVDYIKMDIEGAERRALAGARKVLATFRPRMAISVYHLADDPEVIPAVIQSAFKSYNCACGMCGPKGGRIRPEVYFFY